MSHGLDRKGSRRRMLGGCALALTIVCALASDWLRNLQVDEAVVHEEVTLEPGDVVFRRGTGALSHAVLSLDATSKYSHVGLVHLIGALPFVVHASPGKSLGSRQEVSVESAASFLGAGTMAALYRPAGKHRTAARLAAAKAHGYALDGKRFDDDFDLATDDELYCTELVWKAYREAGLDLVPGRLDELAIPFSRGEYLLPSRLLESPYLYHVYDFNRKGGV